ncbi:MAG: ShlB/FhaC/HecB family hemolysin secretion/activation protein [Maricaulaceae bacterium]
MPLNLTLRSAAGALVLCLALLCVFPSLSYAQVSPSFPANIDPAEELEREREEERRREELENFERREPAPAPDSAPLEPQAAPSGDGPCVQIDSIIVSGARKLDNAGRTSHLIAGYAPSCMTKEDISAVMKAIDTGYVELGFITSRAYIEKQNFKDKTLKLRVVEGVVEAIRFEDAEGGKEAAQRLVTAFPKPLGRVLQLRDFEQGLDQINRLQSAKAKMKLAPGEKPGGSVVNITVEDKHRLRTFASWSNQGSKATGKDQFRLGLSAENVLKANDIWGVSYVGTLNSNAISVNGSMPLGYLTLNMGAVASDYLIGLTPTSELYGDTFSANASLNYVINRDSQTKSFVEVGIEGRQARRFINAFQLTPQSLVTARLTAGHIIETKRAKISMDASYLRGVSLFGATKDPIDVGQRDAHAQFEAFEFGVARLPKPQKWGRWIVSARAKVSGTPLYGPEQTPIGARSTVRGFKNTALSADKAVYIRNDFLPATPQGWKDMSKKLPGGPEGHLSKVSQSLQPYAFFDAGMGKSLASKRTEVAGGIGMGIKLKGKYASFDIGGEIPMAKREFREFNKPRVLASLSLKWP